MTFSIVYVSSATTLLTIPELHALLEHSQRNNARLGVTGAMLYQDGNIMQVLEGDADVVEALFATIDRDQRHHGVIRIFDGWNDHQQFADWSMAFGDLGRDDLALGIGVADLLGSLGADANRSMARLLLSSFRTTLNPRRLTA